MKLTILFLIAVLLLPLSAYVQSEDGCTITATSPAECRELLAEILQ